MPVVDRQIEPQFGFIDAVHQQPAVRDLRNRHPGFELGIDLERIRMIVKEDVDQFTGVDQQGIQLKAGQNIAGAFL